MYKNIHYQRADADTNIQQRTTNSIQIKKIDIIDQTKNKKHDTC